MTMLVKTILAWSALYALCVSAALSLGGCSTLEQRANSAAVADSVTTAAGIAMGLTEVNPLGLLTIPIKVVALIYADSLPDGERAEFHAVAGPVWGGLAVSNVCMIGVLLTAGAFAPVCIAGGIVFGVQQWFASSKEREFYAACRRQHDARCEYQGELQ